jgi:hypothetical protein
MTAPRHDDNEPPQADTNHPADPRTVPPLMTTTWETALGDPDPLVALGATRALAGLLSTWEARLAAEATHAGATWETIGATVGVTRQAAWERFHAEAHELRRSWKTEMHDLKSRHRDEMHELSGRIREEATSLRRRVKGMKGRRRPTRDST